jgi:hypothetical protein
MLSQVHTSRSRERQFLRRSEETDEIKIQLLRDYYRYRQNRPQQEQESSCGSQRELRRYGTLASGCFTLAWPKQQREHHLWSLWTLNDSVFFWDKIQVMESANSLAMPRRSQLPELG